MHGLKQKFTVSGLKTYCEKNELTIHRKVQLHFWTESVLG
jgi:hypothetical protein